MNALPHSVDSTRLDVRPIVGGQKHAVIMQRWEELPVGSHFVLINDHDPAPLRYQFAAQFPGAFTWEYLVNRENEVAVKITRTAVSPAATRTPTPAPASAPCATDTVDARGLEPPEPMVRILAAIETLRPGGTLRTLTDRRPIHLLQELTARGIRFTSEEQSDGSWLNILSRD